MNVCPWIVVTSINPPTKAVRKFAELAQDGWRMVVAGDVKSPSDWSLAGVDFLDIDAQKDRFGELADLVPLRHYARKNLAYLYAIENGANLILDTDDDNIPDDSFGQQMIQDVNGYKLTGPGWINIYSHFSKASHLWPRGLPLKAVGNRGTVSKKEVYNCPIQQFLADEDPDVDAIYRLLINEPVRFDRNAGPFVLSPDTWCPFNSQNTVFFPEAFPLLYLPGFVSFRMTDIWRSFVAQAALARFGRGLSFHAPTVWQERNVHDFMKDFEDEVPGYLHNEDIMNVIVESVSEAAPSGIRDLALAIWEALHQHGTVTDEEMAALKAWHDRLSGALSANSGT